MHKSTFSTLTARSDRAGHLRYFLTFSNKKNWFFAFFIKPIWLGVGCLNRTGAEIGYQLDQKCQKIIFLLLKKLKKYLKCPGYWRSGSSTGWATPPSSLASPWSSGGLLSTLTHSFLTEKQLFPGFFTFFYAIFKFLRPEHDWYAKFTSCST